MHLQEEKSGESGTQNVVNAESESFVCAARRLALVFLPDGNRRTENPDIKGKAPPASCCRRNVLFLIFYRRLLVFYFIKVASVKSPFRCTHSI